MVVGPVLVYNYYLLTLVCKPNKPVKPSVSITCLHVTFNPENAAWEAC